MGTHRPLRQRLLARMRSKRFIVVTAATGAVVIAGGAAGAAVTDFSPAPQSATSQVKPPHAATSAPSSSASPDPEAREQARSQAKEQRQAAAEQAHQAATGALQPEQRQPEPTPQADSGDSSESGEAGEAEGGAELSATGQGGQCEASMYGQGQQTASGEYFDPSAMTAAHKTLPFDTMVRVTNTANGKSVTVRINDRGPYIPGRCIDLSTAAFEQIAPLSAGVADVQWQIVQ
ncbi:septal ring lytic transglycosylase RlpA family protein [Salinactinospora qingdaonensis]|uniref:Probable endolytic peptidoglycan transglycosylase RlpA n=1 Tax=Salinactinospora qingdaonensis TaxID=702744 RepID=A0ABP7GNL0_9ACTN